MSLEAQRVYLSNKFTQGGIDLPVAMPNVTFNIPVADPYGEFHIIGGSPPLVMGGEGTGLIRSASFGFVQLTVWVPEGKGTKGAAQAGDRFAAIFDSKVGRDGAGQVYKFGLVQSFTPDTKAGWSCSVFRVPFRREQVQPVQISI